VTPPKTTDAAPHAHPVLDMHVHPLLTECWHPGTVEFVRSMNPEVVERTSLFTDPTYMRSYLDEQGIAHAVFLAEEAPATSGMTPSEAVQDYVAGVRGFHLFASINPLLESDPRAKLQALLARGPVAGLKLMPTYQYFHPADPSLYPLYALAEESGLPCTFHTGLSRLPKTRLKYADPLLLDDVAVDFPDLSILLAHAGRGVWYEQAALMAGLHKNVYLEISGLPPRNLPAYFPRLERLADKIVFGSDWPGLPSLAANVEAVREVFDEDVARSVLWETGARLLGLAPVR
jgi:predicted TIM-barrel fold metal-dependent hydrolase